MTTYRWSRRTSILRTAAAGCVVVGGCLGRLVNRSSARVVAGRSSQSHWELGPRQVTPYRLGLLAVFQLRHKNNHQIGGEKDYALDKPDKMITIFCISWKLTANLTFAEAKLKMVYSMGWKLQKIQISDENWNNNFRQITFTFICWQKFRDSWLMYS